MTLAVAGNTVTFFHYSFLIVPLLVMGGILLSESKFNIQIPKKLQALVKSRYARGLGVLICIGGIAYWAGIVLSNSYKIQAVKLASSRPPALEEAFVSLESAIFISPLRADLYFTKGKIWLKVAILSADATNKQRSFQNALEAFDKAVALNSGESTYRKARSSLSVTSGDYKKALYYMNDALVYDPCSAELAYGKAIILEKLGKIDDSILILKAALSAGKSFVLINHEVYKPMAVMLVDLLRKSGNIKKAEQIKEEYIELLQVLDSKQMPSLKPGN